ncbi:hypothetical protein BE08_34845 [Sorangium cellulosum]|uniref:Uncharacterized protein n=1 Tax=Sorangium cellulosum TaxID=56 RepID=A0A150P521_SORCE|nr:hypothetical protein BE08_34845 [Sorangium cellulosum]
MNHPPSYYTDDLPAELLWRVFDDLDANGLKSFAVFSPGKMADVHAYVQHLVDGGRLVFSAKYHRGKMRGWEVKHSHLITTMSPAEILDRWAEGYMDRA